MLRSADILSQLALLDQFQKSEIINYDFKAWLTFQRYFIDDDITKTSFSLRTVDDTYQKAIANDTDKFAKFSIETICAVQPNRIFTSNSSWPTINLYYSSFFAAHSLLRIFGMAYSQLNSDHLKKIMEVARMYGKDAGHTAIESGFYKSTFDKKTKILTFQKMEDSHADLWVCFLSLLQKLIADVKGVSAITQDKLDCMNMLSEIKHAITQEKGKTKGNWLSIIRNNVNYQGTNGSWYPYSGLEFDTSILETIPRKLLIQNIGKTLINDTSALDTSLNTNLRIVNLLVHLLKICNKKFENENFNFKNGSLKMINIVKI